MHTDKTTRSRGKTPRYVPFVGYLLAAVAVLILLGAVGVGIGMALNGHGQAAQRTISKALGVSGTPRIVVRDRVGAVRITGGDDNRVRVIARVRARGISPDAAREMLARTQVRVTRERGVIYIRTTPAGDNDFMRHVSVNYSIAVPRGSSLDVGLNVGDMEIRDMSGRVVANVDAGNAKLIRAQLSGDSQVSVKTGKATVAGTLMPRTSLKVSVHTGDAEVTLPGAPKTRLDAVVNVGEIETHNWRVRRTSTGTGQSASQKFGNTPYAGLSVTVDVGKIELTGSR